MSRAPLILVGIACLASLPACGQTPADSAVGQEASLAWHGVRLHMAADCSDIRSFKASGRHVEGACGSHGFLSSEGTHGGDLPNIYAHTNGIAHAGFFTASVTLSDFKDSDGASLIIHAAPDDYQTQPIRGAAGRIACAAFDEQTQPSKEKYHEH